MGEFWGMVRPRSSFLATCSPLLSISPPWNVIKWVANKITVFHLWVVGFLQFANVASSPSSPTAACGILKATGCAPSTLSFTRTAFLKWEEREVVLLARQPCFSCISEIKGELFHHPRKFTGREHPSFLFHMVPTCLGILNLQHSRNKNQTQKSRNPERLSGLSESSAPHTPSYRQGWGGRTVQRNSEVGAQGFY